MNARQRHKQRPGRKHWVYRVEFEQVSQVRPFAPPVRAAPGDQVLFVGDNGPWGIGQFNAVSPHDLRHPERASLLQIQLTFVNQSNGKQLPWRAASQRLGGPVARNVQRRVHASETSMIMVSPGEWRALKKMLDAIPQPPPPRTSAQPAPPAAARPSPARDPAEPATISDRATARPNLDLERPSEPRGEHRYWITSDGTNDEGIMVRQLTYPGGEVRPGDPVVLITARGDAKLAEVMSVAAGAARSQRSLRMSIKTVTQISTLDSAILTPFRGNVNGRLAELTELEWRSLTGQGLVAIGRSYLSEATISLESAREISSLFTTEKLLSSSNQHRTLQNTLADLLTATGLHPLSPGVDTPPFDLAYNTGATTILVEVKSLNDDNESHQLRTGLGQVLYYTELLRPRVAEIRAVLFVERAPTETIWVDVCGRAGVVLAWPDTVNRMPGLVQAQWPQQDQYCSNL